MKVARAVAPVAVLAAVLAGCTKQQPPAPTPTPTPPPKVASQIDPRWMGFDKIQPWNWEDSDRKITKDFQQFGFRPAGETELPRGCNGCGEQPATARVSIYAPGKVDPADPRTGQPVGVSGRDGFFRPSDGSQDAILTWQYADNAWATVRGTTTATSNVDRLMELARALRPDDRTPVRVPLSLANLPATMPLAEVGTEPAPYGTTLLFGACEPTGIPPECTDKSDHLRVQIWQADGYSGHINEQNAVAVKIGGKDGKYDKRSSEAAVQVQAGMLVVFSLSDSEGFPNAAAQLEDILANVAWAPDPGNKATWQAVTDWTK